MSAAICLLPLQSSVCVRSTAMVSTIIGTVNGRARNERREYAEWPGAQDVHRRGSAREPFQLSRKLADCAADHLLRHGDAQLLQHRGTAVYELETVQPTATLHPRRAHNEDTLLGSGSHRACRV